MTSSWMCCISFYINSDYLRYLSSSIIYFSFVVLTHWGRVTHICVGNLTIIVSDNGWSPDRRQAIIGTNAGVLSIEPLGINFSEISMEIQTFSFRKMRSKSSSAKWRPFSLGLNVLIHLPLGDLAINLRVWAPTAWSWWSSWVPLMKLLSGKNHKTSLIINQYWFG